MLRIFHGTKFDFLKLNKVAAGVAGVFVVGALASMLVLGMRYSIEFTGGTLVQGEFTAAPDVTALRTAMAGAGVPDAEITSFGSPTEFTIRAQDASSVETQAAGAEGVAARIEAGLQTFAPGAHTIVRTEAVGPRVGEELSRNAMIAVLISLCITLLYLAWRFETRLGAAAVAATAFGIFGTLTLIKVLDLEISLTVIAAILTVIGYSLNDTIIIFDRVRENLLKLKKVPLYDVLNVSINETLPRSVLTHGTTISATLALLFLGGEVIRPFAIVMTFGVLVGTFGSMVVAPSLLIWIERKYPRATVTASAKA